MRLFQAIKDARPWRAGVLLWALLTAAVGGAFVALAVMQSPEGVYRSAVLPVALLALTIFVYFIDRGDSSAPVLILLAAYFLPFRISTGSESPIVDSLALTVAFVGIWIVRKVILREKKWLYPSPVNLPLLGFVGVTIVSLLWSILFRDPNVYVWDRFLLVQIASTFVMVMLPLALLLVANQIASLKQLRWMAGLTIGVGIAGFLMDRFSLPLPVNTGGLVSMWVIAISASLAIFQRRLPWSIRLGLFALASWWIYRGFVLNLQWIAGWLPSFVAICVLSFMRSWRALLVVLVILFLLIGLNQEFYLGTFIEQEAEESLYTRLDAWRVNWGLTKEHLLLGTGPAGYAAYYMTYYPTRAMATHNNFIDVFAQTGVLGLGLLIWMLTALIIVGIRVHRRLRNSGTIEESLVNAALAGLVGSIVIMMFGDWLFPFAYTQGIAGFDYIVPTWLFFGVILVLDRMTAENPKSPLTSPQLVNGNPL